MDIENKYENTCLDIFMNEVDKAINSGNVMSIKNAIKNYGNFIDKSYIDWANLIVLEILDEKMEDIAINEFSCLSLSCSLSCSLSYFSCRPLA